MNAVLLSPVPAGSIDDGGPSSRRPPLWLLVLVTFSGTIAMHVFMPALPTAAQNLQASASSMQLTVSLYILGLAAGQLIYGPLSDRYGRRPTLLVGMSIYSVAGLAAALAPTVETLIAARLFQALGGCAGMLLGRTIVRDTSELKDAAKRLALMNLLITVGPGAAPIIGAALASTLGWRSIFYGLAVFGLVNLLCCWKLLPETRPPPAGANSNVAALARNYAKLLRSKVFLGYAVAGGCTTTPMYAFIAAAPFIFTHQLHRPTHEVGLYLALLISGVGVGSFIATRLIPKFALERLFFGSNTVCLIAALVFLSVASFGELSVAWVVCTIFPFTVGLGIGSPAALTEAMSVNPAVTGSASGLYGFTQMLIGATATGVVGLGSSPAVSAGVVLVAACLVGQAGFAVASRAKRAGG